MQEERLLTRKDEKELEKYDVVIDIAHPKYNRDIRFFPMKTTLEGEVRQERLHTDKPSGAIGSLGGVIPGQRMYVDVKNQSVKIIDRKSLQKWKPLLTKALELSRTERYRNFRFNSVKQDIDIGVPDHEWPTWLYHIRLLMNAGKFQAVKGESKIPSIEEIRKMGTVQIYDNWGITPKDSENPFWELQQQESNSSKKVGAS